VARFFGVYPREESGLRCRWWKPPGGDGPDEVREVSVTVRFGDGACHLLGGVSHDMDAEL
jgi:hypothetical protein